jgi:hypothetical protein
MKRLWFAMLVVGSICLVPGSAFAQIALHEPDRVEVGVFGEFYRFDQAGVDLAGVGGRVSVNVTPLVQLEAEAGYDFSQVFTERFSNAFSTTVQTTGTRRLDGLFGPKVETNHGPVRFFLTAKGGATTFGFNPRPVTFGTFFSSVDSVRARDAIAEFYPGVGAEGFIGPIGLRVDVGDEMYFANNVYHNLRVTFGPAIRF